MVQLTLLINIQNEEFLHYDRIHFENTVSTDYIGIKWR